MVTLTKDPPQIAELKGAINHLEFRKATLFEEIASNERRPKWFFSLTNSEPKSVVIAKLRFRVEVIQTELQKLRIELSKRLKSIPIP